MKIRVFLWTVIFWATSLSAFAKPTAFRSEVDKNQVALGDTIQLSLIFEGEQNVPAPDLPAMNEFQAQYLGPSTQFTMVNGQTSMSITHRYALIPQKIGDYEIGPFTATIEGQTYVTKPLAIKITDAPVSSSVSTPASQQNDADLSRASLEKRIFLQLETQKTQAFVNELIPVSIKLYSDRLPLRIDKLPELTAQAGLTALDFDTPRQYKETKDGVSFDVLEFQTRIYASRTGELSLGPARLTPIIVLRKSTPASTSTDPFAGDFFNSIFGGWEEPHPVNVIAEPLILHILPLPEQSKPDTFTGAVGTFHIQVTAEPRKVKEGDPVTLNMAIRGEGNFNSVRPPRLEGTENFKIYDPKTVSSTDQEKVFEQVVLPKTSDIRRTPAPVFSFFDPKSGMYQTLTPGPFPLEVEKQEAGIPPAETAVSATPPKNKEPETRQEIVFIKEVPGPCGPNLPAPYQRFSFWMIQFIPLAALTSGLFYQRRRRKIASDSGFARRLRAPGKARKGLARAADLMKKSRSPEFYDCIQKVLRDYLGDRFHVPSGGLTAQTAAQFLQEKHIPRDTAQKITNLFGECDAVRFAKRVPKASDMERIWKELAETIDSMEKNKT